MPSFVIKNTEFDIVNAVEVKTLGLNFEFLASILSIIDRTLNCYTMLDNGTHFIIVFGLACSFIYLKICVYF